ncbi:MAG: NdvB protein [Deltaproteobacteria bacterium]|nr:NdvB protein [Deltaproteobacteria bacterium]
MNDIYRHEQQGAVCILASPTALPQAAAFLWNRRMMLHVNCRGYAVSQFMQPEPAKYAHQPVLEAKTFMQPEQPYFTHHPGRFFYVKDEDSGRVFSVPFEPVRAALIKFEFVVRKYEVGWRVHCDDFEVHAFVSVPVDDVVELWRLTVRDVSGRARRLSVYAYFPVGYASWMNQSGECRPDLGGVVASCVTPYQKVQDYFKNQHFKDKTFLLADEVPTAYEANQAAFEGWGGLAAPTGVTQPSLSGGDARYEVAACVLQWRRLMPADGAFEARLIFGPAETVDEIRALRDKYLRAGGFEQAARAYEQYVASGSGCLQIETPDEALDHFVNHWMARQTFYHCDVNRLTTDPQTRNYLQDAMGAAFVQPVLARAAFIRALSQQQSSGAMPDGILLVEGAELKYINQVPHMDHCVWLPICLSAYLDETNDFALLEHTLPFADGGSASVRDHIDRAMQWLHRSRDERGLNFIAQGDWCDPMNMVGWKGRGVSGWLSLATAYAHQVWASICERVGRSDEAARLRAAADEVNAAVNHHLWDGQWYARGITDDGVAFGVAADEAGKVFLNPQSWSMLSGAADAFKRRLLMQAVQDWLDTPFGVMKLAPPYQAMREDVGRVTQKHPGSAENGAVYNHAAAFYAYALYEVKEADAAFKVLRQMLPGPDVDDIVARGQLPVFIPNYYRGAYREFPRTAGRSSQLFNTGTVAWFYRCLVERLFGLQGTPEGLLVQPQLPAAWQRARAVRQFRGATFDVTYERRQAPPEITLVLDGEPVAGTLVRNIQAGATYHLQVLLPA